MSLVSVFATDLRRQPKKHDKLSHDPTVIPNMLHGVFIHMAIAITIYIKTFSSWLYGP